LSQTTSHRAVEFGVEIGEYRVPPIYGLNPATTALTNRIEQYPMAR
jgi:hypothetical protein